MEQSNFINEFVSLGMYDYFNGLRENVFERHIVECLCDIYGKESIKRLYENNQENEFAILIHRYGLAPNVYDNFLRDTAKYVKFKQENALDPSKKSNIASAIESSIISMFLYKSLMIEPTLEELSHFENDLLNDFSIIKLHFNTSLNPNMTREIWEKKKKILADNVELIEIKPKYLDEFTYTRFGTSLKDVKKMDYRMVEELNNYILAKLNSVPNDDNDDKKSSMIGTTIISSGNGFVDALLITAIIATEMSIGLIYLFLNM